MTAREYYKQKYGVEPNETGESMISNKEILDLQDEFLQAVNKANENKTSDERERLIHFLTESMKDKDSITIEQQVDTYLLNN